MGAFPLLLTWLLVSCYGTSYHDMVRDWNCGQGPKQSNIKASDSEVQALFESVRTGQHGIWPHMFEQKCGSSNLNTPKIWTGKARGRIGVDVGMGEEARETREAVRNGWIVFSVEMQPRNIQAIEQLWLHGSYRQEPRFKIIIMNKSSDGKWIIPERPKPPNDGKGFAYIHLCALAKDEGTVYLSDKASTDWGATRGIGINTNSRGDVAVPILPLDRLLPSWAKQIDFVKLDTQGAELQVLQGAAASLEARRFKYIQYEFSPWLMKWGRKSFGDSRELLHLLPNTGALCFDMMSLHNKNPRGPSQPLDAYYDALNSAKHSIFKRGDHKLEDFGPWEDILCYWPSEVLPLAKSSPPAQSGDAVVVSSKQPEQTSAIATATLESTPIVALPKQLEQTSVIATATSESRPNVVLPVTQTSVTSNRVREAGLESGSAQTTVQSNIASGIGEYVTSVKFANSDYLPTKSSDLLLYLACSYLVCYLCCRLQSRLRCSSGSSSADDNP